MTEVEGDTTWNGVGRACPVVISDDITSDIGPKKNLCLGWSNLCLTNDFYNIKFDIMQFIYYENIW
jgi:hypothetical protein